jgi:hypothetical protein
MWVHICIVKVGDRHSIPFHDNLLLTSKMIFLSGIKCSCSFFTARVARAPLLLLVHKTRVHRGSKGNTTLMGKAKKLWGSSVLWLCIFHARGDVA